MLLYSAVRKIISDARQLAAFTTGSVKEALLEDAKSAEVTLDQLEGKDFSTTHNDYDSLIMSHYL